MSKVSIRAASSDDYYDLRGRFRLVIDYSLQNQLFHVAATDGCKSCGRDTIVGYVHSVVHKETNECKVHAEIRNVEVSQGNRGIATKLVTAAHADLERMYDPEYISALVPRSNFEAYCFFSKTLGYNIHGADLENNAYILRKQMHSGEMQ